MDGRVADAGDGGKDASPVHLLLRLLTVCGTFGDKLREIDLSGSDIALDGGNDCRRYEPRVPPYLRIKHAN